jgi:S-adenosylmethionine hydrolase
MRWITLTTDFGTADWFVGAMKGVLAARAPQARVVDLTHGVPPGDIRAAAFALRSGCAWFPPRTVHVVVVDPGVGSARAGLAVRTARYDFVGPDNGVLSWALERERVRSVRAIRNENLLLQPVSATFHGRDVFAPAAAHLAAGGAFSQLGPSLARYARLPWPEIRPTRSGWVGEVVHVDRFGNAITNLPAPAAGTSGAAWAVRWEGGGSCRLEACYAAVGSGEPVGVAGSTGFVEIAVNGGRACDRLGLRVGVVVELAPVRRGGYSPHSVSAGGKGRRMSSRR